MLFVSTSLSLFFASTQILYFLLLCLSHSANPHLVFLHTHNSLPRSLSLRFAHFLSVSLSQHGCYQVSDSPDKMWCQAFNPNLTYRPIQPNSLRVWIRNWSSFSLFWSASGLTNIILKTAVQREAVIKQFTDVWLWLFITDEGQEMGLLCWSFCFSIPSVACLLGTSR